MREGQAEGGGVGTRITEILYQPKRGGQAGGKGLMVGRSTLILPKSGTGGG